MSNLSYIRLTSALSWLTRRGKAYENLMNLKKLLLIYLFLFCSLAVVKPQTTTPPQTILIRAGRVFDSEKGKVVISDRGEPDQRVCCRD